MLKYFYLIKSLLNDEIVSSIPNLLEYKKSLVTMQVIFS